MWGSKGLAKRGYFFFAALCFWTRRRVCSLMRARAVTASPLSTAAVGAGTGVLLATILSGVVRGSGLGVADLSAGHGCVDQCAVPQTLWSGGVGMA